MCCFSSARTAKTQQSKQCEPKLKCVQLQQWGLTCASKRAGWEWGNATQITCADGKHQQITYITSCVRDDEHPSNIVNTHLTWLIGMHIGISLASLRMLTSASLERSHRHPGSFVAMSSSARASWANQSIEVGFVEQKKNSKNYTFESRDLRFFSFFSEKKSKHNS